MPLSHVLVWLHDSPNSRFYGNCALHFRSLFGLALGQLSGISDLSSEYNAGEVIDSNSSIIAHSTPNIDIPFTTLEG